MLHNHLRNFTSHKFVIYFHPADQSANSSHRVHQLRPRIKIRGNHVRCLRDARLSVTLRISRAHSRKKSGGSQKKFLCIHK